MNGLKHLNFFEKLMLRRILKKTVKQGNHKYKIKGVLFELMLEARTEFCEDDNITFKNFMKSLYDEQLKFLGKKKMGLSPIKNCYTNEQATAPNPSPDKWELLSLFQFENAYILKVKYTGCTNFEGIKLMVYEGIYVYKGNISILDPHFSERNDSPIARFKPDEKGIEYAIDFCKSVK